MKYRSRSNIDTAVRVTDTKYHRSSLYSSWEMNLKLGLTQMLTDERPDRLTGMRIPISPHAIAGAA